MERRMNDADKLLEEMLAEIKQGGPTLIQWLTGLALVVGVGVVASKGEAVRVVKELSAMA